MSAANSEVTPLLVFLAPPTSGTTFLPREDSLVVLSSPLVAKVLPHAALPEQTLDLLLSISVLPQALMLPSLALLPLMLNSILIAKLMAKPSLVFLALLLFGIMLLVGDTSAVLGFLLVEEAILLAMIPLLPLLLLLPLMLTAMPVFLTPETVLKLSPGLKLTLVPPITLNTEESAIMLLVWPLATLLVVSIPLSFTGKTLLKDSDITIELLPQAPSFSSEVENMVTLVSLLVAETSSPLISMALVL